MCWLQSRFELYNLVKLLLQYRSVPELKHITPTDTQWRYGMVAYNTSFMRVAFRSYERLDEAVNNVSKLSKLRE